MAEMTLREICQTLGISRRAVQGYEKARLVSATGETESGYLLYNDFAKERIRQIKLFQDMGFSIKEIQAMIDAPSDIKRAALMQRKEKLNEDIQHNIAIIAIIQEMLMAL